MCAALVAHARLFDFVCDDAFISFRYAGNFARHGSFVYNLGERVEGYTNFLWTLLMAGIIRLGGDPVPWSKILGIGFGMTTLVLLARFAARWRALGDESGSRWNLLAPALLATAPAYACWCTGGLETQLFTCAVTWGWTSHLTELTTLGARPWSGIGFALAAMTRPEGALFFGLAFLHGAISRRFARGWRRELGPLVAFTALFVPYFAWRWSYYGWPLPNTFYAKAGAVHFWKPGLHELAAWVASHPLLFAAALAVLVLARRRVDAAPAGLGSLAALYCVALSIYVLRIGGDFMTLNRYLVPLMPILALVAARSVQQLAMRLREAGVSRAARASLAASCVVLAALHVAHVDRRALRVERASGVDSIGLLRVFAAQWTAIGQWLGAHARAGTTIATTAAGAIPYYSRLYTLDMLGLNDAWVAHHVPATGDEPGHAKVAPGSYIVEKKIDLVIVHPVIEPARPLPSDEDRRYWTAQGYEWTAVRVPGLVPPWWGYWQKHP